MHGGGREAALGQLGGDLVAGAAGAAEHDRQAAALGLQHPGEHLDLVEVVRAEDVLVGGGHVGGLVVLLGPDVGRPVQVPPGERHDLRRHGGREQHRLPVRGRQPQDRLDVGKEAEVQHPVGLVEDENVDGGQVKLALPDQVKESARRADHDVDGGERLDLRLIGAAAVQGHDVDVGVDRRGAHVVGYLDGQFPGRDDDEGARRRGLAAWRVDQVLQDRDRERERLAGAGSGLSDDVVLVERDRQCQRLDREGVRDAGRRERRADRLGDSELVEGQVAGCWPARSSPARQRCPPAGHRPARLAQRRRSWPRRQAVLPSGLLSGL